MFAIQWYDPYDLTPAGRARKDGTPRGAYHTKELATKAAENAQLRGGDEGIPFTIVEFKEESCTCKICNPSNPFAVIGIKPQT